MSKHQLFGGQLFWGAHIAIVRDTGDEALDQQPQGSYSTNVNNVSWTMMPFPQHNTNMLKETS